MASYKENLVYLEGRKRGYSDKDISSLVAKFGIDTVYDKVVNFAKKQQPQTNDNPVATKHVEPRESTYIVGTDSSDPRDAYSVKADNAGMKATEPINDIVGSFVNNVIAPPLNLLDKGYKAIEDIVYKHTGVSIDEATIALQAAGVPVLTPYNFAQGTLNFGNVSRVIGARLANLNRKWNNNYKLSMIPDNPQEHYEIIYDVLGNKHFVDPSKKAETIKNLFGVKPSYADEFGKIHLLDPYNKDPEYLAKWASESAKEGEYLDKFAASFGVLPDPPSEIVLQAATSPLTGLPIPESATLFNPEALAKLSKKLKSIDIVDGEGFVAKKALTAPVLPDYVKWPMKTLNDLPGLTESERNLLGDYASQGAYSINAHAWLKKLGESYDDGLVYKSDRIIDIINKARANNLSYNNPVYRLRDERSSVIDDIVNAVTEDKPFEYSGIISTSYTPESKYIKPKLGSVHSSPRKGNGVFYEILNGDGAPMGPVHPNVYNSEAEVILPPGKFKIEDIKLLNMSDDYHQDVYAQRLYVKMSALKALFPLGIAPGVALNNKYNTRRPQQ